MKNSGEGPPKKISSDRETPRVRFPDDPYQMVTNGDAIISMVRNYWLRVQKYRILLNIKSQSFTILTHLIEIQIKVLSTADTPKKIECGFV